MRSQTDALPVDGQIHFQNDHKVGNGITASLPISLINAAL